MDMDSAWSPTVHAARTSFDGAGAGQSNDRDANASAHGGGRNDDGGGDGASHGCEGGGDVDRGRSAVAADAATRAAGGQAMQRAATRKPDGVNRDVPMPRAFDGGHPPPRPPRTNLPLDSPSSAGDGSKMVPTPSCAASAAHVLKDSLPLARSASATGFAAAKTATSAGFWIAETSLKASS